MIRADFSSATPNIDITGGADVRVDVNRRGPRGRQGEPGPGVDDVTVSAGSRRAVVTLRNALRAGAARIVWLGDSDTEGTGAGDRANRYLELVTEGLRARYFPSAGGDTGKGYVPVDSWTFWGFPDDPTWSGEVVAIGNGGGLGNRSAVLKSAGATITWPSLDVRYLRLHYTLREAAYGGTATIKADGVTIHTLDTVTSGAEGAAVWEHDFGTTSARVISVEWVSGQPRIEGLTAQTSLTGVTSWDAARSGAKVRDYRGGGLASGAGSDELHWGSVALLEPHLGVAAFGSNDMSSYGPDLWGQYLAEYLAAWKVAAPDAGLVFIHSGLRVEDVDTPEVLAEYEAAARAAIGDDPLVTILYERVLWTPLPGHDYGTTADPTGYLADTTHKSQLGHELFADIIDAAINLR